MKPSQDWIEDCAKYWGKTLTGEKAHWCPEWDDLPIDETCSEFEHCICDIKKEPEPKQAMSLADILGAALSKEQP